MVPTARRLSAFSAQKDEVQAEVKVGLETLLPGKCLAGLHLRRVPCDARTVCVDGGQREKTVHLDALMRQQRSAYILTNEALPQ